jgi:hypothetical protein
MRGWRRVLTAISLLLLLIAVPGVLRAQTIVINEIRIDQPSTDNDEYFELAGPPGASLAGLTYLVIGDGAAAAGSGVIEVVVDLTGQTIPASGFFVAAEGTFTLGTANLTTSLNFENTDNFTHFLVQGFTGIDGQDLDTNDDGVLDVTPWTAIVDRIALIVQQNPPTTTEFHYGPPTVGPDGTFVPGHVFRSPDGTGAFQIGAFDPVGGADTPGEANAPDIEPPLAVTIAEIQGPGDASPLVGRAVTTTGVVTGDFQGNNQLRGFFIQDPSGDGDALSSDGIFVFNPEGTNAGVGDVVEVTGIVQEFFGMTEITSVSNVTITGTSTPLAPTPVSLPESVDGDLERYEGMLIRITNPMTVAQNFFLGRYGQMTLASPDDLGNPGQLFQPTNQFRPLTPEALDLADANARRLLVLDDGQDISSLGDNPNPVPYIGPPPPDVIRGGDTVTNLIGVLDYGRINSAADPARDYRLHPTVEPTFTPSNPRPQTPQAVGGNLRVASFNVLNYFPTLDVGPFICGPDGDQECRGANSVTEFTRQRDKIIEAMRRMNAHIIGLLELENPRDEGPELALEDLVAGLNAVTAPGTYAFINTGTIGTDAIKVAFIYQPAVVTPIGFPAVLTDGIDPRTIDTQNRPPLAQTFERKGRRADLQRFTVVVNHFKSKGSDCNTPADGSNEIADPDTGDGQGNCNLTRVSIAKALIDWLRSDPTGSGDPDFLIIGDLNSYAQEDPLRTFTSAGYTNLVARFVGNDAYSFTFDGLVGYLDHALANSLLARQVTGATEWHINTDEPTVIDYNVEFNPSGYYSADPFRASDHDPVLVGLNLLCGDLDDDGDVDSADLRRVVAALHPGRYNHRADYNGDGRVDARDLLLWTACQLKFKIPAR